MLALLSNGSVIAASSDGSSEGRTTITVDVVVDDDDGDISETKKYHLKRAASHRIHDESLSIAILVSHNRKLNRFHLFYSQYLQGEDLMGIYEGGSFTA